MGLEKWNHLAMSYNGREIRLYLNGKLDGRLTASGGINKNNTSLWIGKRPDRESVCLHGFMDELAILDTALTESEIKKHMEEGVEQLSQ